jgi:hypothetical protein
VVSAIMAAADPAAASRRLRIAIKSARKAREAIDSARQVRGTIEAARKTDEDGS